MRDHFLSRHRGCSVAGLGQPYLYLWTQWNHLFGHLVQQRKHHHGRSRKPGPGRKRPGDRYLSMQPRSLWGQLCTRLRSAGPNHRIDPMTRTCLPIRCWLKQESGQVLPLVAVMFVVLLGLAGLTVDVGHAFYCYRALQQAADAATLAGASSIRTAANSAAVIAQANALS